MQERFDVRIVGVVAQVAVELAVVDVSGISLFARPDLLGAFGIARERGHAAGAEDGPERTVARARRTERDAVRIDEEKVDARFAEVFVDAGCVGALRQPDAARTASEMFA